MGPTRYAVAALLLAVTLVAAGCGGSDEESATDTETTTETTAGGVETTGTGQSLLGSVGPGFEISLTTSTHQTLGTVAPGTYELQVDDKSSQHNFHLTGPGGVDVSTDVSDSGSESFTVDLEPGTYTFVCDPHSSSMNGSFEVSG